MNETEVRRDPFCCSKIKSTVTIVRVVKKHKESRTPLAEIDKVGTLEIDCESSEDCGVQHQSNFDWGKYVHPELTR